jgi:2-oxoglutarate dehydrogenase E2 component (dihydrolipoamide succinyltransferase)
MARIEVPMPQMGESIAEGTVSKWLKQAGDAVARDEPLLEISTDKVDAEIPAPAAGQLADILVAEGQTVEVGTVVAYIETEPATAAATPKPDPPSPRPRPRPRLSRKRPVPPRAPRHLRAKRRPARTAAARAPRKGCVASRRRSFAGSPRSTASISVR